MQNLLMLYKNSQLMKSYMTTNAMLAHTLEQIGVHFIRTTDEPVDAITSPDMLLRGLASSDEARMRLSLIPLFLNHPHYAGYVVDVLTHLTLAQQQLLRCYYTAAQLLQQKYYPQLIKLFGNNMALPSLFDNTLGIDDVGSPDKRLRQLAGRQAQLSGKPLNWYGTYEHAYTRLTHTRLTRLQYRENHDNGK